MPFISTSRKQAFRHRLARWYKRQGRHDLPWRGAFAPYQVLVSEFMLQQTTVATVIPYFHRFLRSFPTVEKLARSPLEKVLERWAGLGYYARARNLHRTAKILVRDYGSRLPLTRDQAESLPGVGPYTAGALLSFAHNLPEALVDGNVIRVLARVFGVKEDPRQPAVRRHLWALAQSLVPPNGGRHYNSALMDFGATVCTTGLPDCPACPLSSLCWARRNDWVQRLPVPKPDSPKTVVRLSALVVTQDGRILLRRRPLGGLWGGLWELPTLEGPVVRGQPVVVAGGEIVPVGQRGAARHVLSHRDLRVDLWEGRLVRPIHKSKWVRLSAVRSKAVSALTAKLIDQSTAL
ncbi:MAG: A/G-specific adenine glycosylase [Elusimicrobia bacterium]|nr:A/G-specific adenine glycosylase [Elusimicrobiota bacterium]